MRSRNINQQLQTRVMKYLDHMIHKQLESPEKGQEILKKMSKKIRDEIYKDFFGKILTNSKMFKFNFSEAFLKDLTIQMKEIICRPGEIIFSFNEVDNREVELFLEKYKKKDDQDNYSYDILTKGDIFGEQSFFTSKLRESSAKSLSVSHLIYCTYEDFVSVLKQFPKDYEKFCQMKDEVLNYGEQLNTRCAVCQKFRHSIVDCPYIHLKRRRDIVIHKHIRSIPNERSKHDRRKIAKINTFSINEKVKIKLRKLRKVYVTKTNKQMKDENNNILLDDNKAGYFINVKKSGDSDDSTDSILSEKTHELRKLSDKKFFLTTPKLCWDQHQQICIQNDEDEFIDEDEEIEFQNDSQDIQIQDDEEEDDILGDDIDDDDDDDEDEDDQDDDEEDEIFDSENSQDPDYENNDDIEQDVVINPQNEIIQEQELMQNETTRIEVFEPIRGTKKLSIFKPQDTEKKQIENQHNNIYQTPTSGNKLDNDDQQQQESQTKIEYIDDFNLTEVKKISSVTPNIQFTAFNNYETHNLVVITPQSKDDAQQQKLAAQKYQQTNLTVSPSSPTSTAVKSNFTSNLHLQSDRGNDSKGEQDSKRGFFSKTESENNQNIDIIQPFYTQRHQFEQTQTNNQNQNNINFYSNGNSYNHSKSTSCAEQVTQYSSTNKGNFVADSHRQQEIQNLQFAINEQNLHQIQKQKINSEETLKTKSLEETDRNQINSLKHISRNINFEQIQSLDNKLSSLREVMSEQEKSRLQNEQIEGGQDNFFDDNQSSQKIQSLAENLDLDEKEQIESISQVSIGSNLVQPNKPHQKRSRSQQEIGKKQQNNTQNNDEKRSKQKILSLNKKKHNDLESNQQFEQPHQSYKDKNRLIFKGSIFQLKIAGISQKNKSKKLINSTSNRRHSTYNSQIAIGSYDILEDVNTSFNNNQIKQGTNNHSTGKKHKTERQNKEDKEIKSEKNTEPSHRRKSKKDDKLEGIIQAHNERNQLKSARQVEEKKQKKRMSQYQIKIDTQSIQQAYKQSLSSPYQNDRNEQQQVQDLQAKVDKSLDSCKSSRSSTLDIKNNTKKLFEKQDSIKVRRQTQSNKVIDPPGILKSKKTINLTINTSEIQQQPPPLITMTPQTNKHQLQRKQTNQSETPRHQTLMGISQNEQEFFPNSNIKRRDKKTRILTTIVSPTNIESTKAPSKGGSIFPPGNLLRLPAPFESTVNPTQSEEKKLPIKRKGTKNDSNNQNNNEVLQLPLNQNLIGVINNNNGGNTVTSQANSFGIQSNKNSVMSNQLTNNSFNQTGNQQQNIQYLKPSNFKSQHDFSSAWLQAQQQQQQFQQSSQSQNQQISQPPNVMHLQIPQIQHHSFSFQNNDGQVAATPSQSQLTSRPIDNQHQQSPPNGFKKQISINQYHNNHQVFTLSSNQLNTPSISQIKTFNHSQSLKQGMQLSTTSNQHIPLPLSNQPSLQPHQQLQHSSTMNINQQNIQQQQQISQQNTLQPPPSQQQISYQNYQSFQNIQALPSHVQMSMMLLPNQNNLFLSQNNLPEHNYIDEQHRNYDFHNQKTLFIYDFDRMKEFTNYFPHNNYSLVCKEKKKIVNRKNYFANKKMGNSSRNIMAKQIPITHPSPRGIFQTGHNFSSSFRGAVNKLNVQNVMGNSKHLNVNQNNNGSQGNINTAGNSNNQSGNKEILNEGRYSIADKTKLKRATESLITSKRNSFRTNSKRSLRGSDNPAITNYNNNNYMPRNTSFFHIPNTENELKNMTNSMESKQNMHGSDRLYHDSIQTDPKNNDTPKIEFSNQQSNQITSKKDSQFMLMTNSIEMKQQGNSMKLGEIQQQSQDQKSWNVNFVEKQQSQSIIIDEKGNQQFKQQDA